MPSKLRNAFILLISLLFYFWGEGVYLWVMLLSIISNYFIGLMLQGSMNKRVILGLGVLFNLGLLIWFKYSNFLVDNLNIVLAPFGSNISLAPVHLPIGISFFTFQALSYIIDVYRTETSAQKNVLSFAMYIALFPQLIAGPIVRYVDIEAAIKNRQVRTTQIAIGIRRFIVGLGKKVIIANQMAIIADAVFKSSVSELSMDIAWLGIICYSLQIFFDFSGYSDMAIGLGKIFGFEFMENFRYPYTARSVKDFWRKWHISLSQWFRDYLYIPLGGNKKGNSRTYLNLILVFFLCGLWHGASWTFVIWGIWHGLFLVMERSKFGNWVSQVPRFLQHLYTLFIVLVGWVFFRAETVPEAWNYLLSMAGLGHSNSPSLVYLYLSHKFWLIFILGILASTTIFYSSYKHLVLHKSSIQIHVVESLTLVLLIFILIFSAIELSSGTYNPFIYFRF